jgi:Concanavalin A-like lectin/glucanases superfamily
MVLRVQPVPAPAAGRDWTYTIPGGFRFDLKAVQATLATPFATTTLADSSGNGLNLTIGGAGTHLNWARAGPYGGGTKNYALLGDQSGAGAGPQMFTVGSALFNTANMSIDALVNLATGADNLDSQVAVRQAGSTVQAALDFQPNSHDPADLRGDAGNVFFSLATGFLPRGGWHHVAVTADGTNWYAYLDGVLKATVAGHQPPAGGGPQYFIAAANGAFRGSIAAVAVYGATLSGGQIAAHAAATGSNAAYKAAVLADSPAGLWMLDDVGQMGSRLATLEITNGTTTIADYPGGAISNIAGSFTWTWASQAPGTAQSADATVNLVQIPDLILPAGYTVGTVTPDLGLADSWTNINIWWNDGQIGPVGPQGPYVYEGVSLVYHQDPGAP